MMTISNLSRRAFVGRGIELAGLLASLPFLGGCPSFLSVYHAIQKYAGVGLQAFSAVVNLLQGTGVIPPGSGTAISLAITLAKAAFADLQTAVTSYLNAPAADKAALLGKLSTALAVAQQSVAQFWNDLQIPDANLAATVQGLLGIILSTLAGFATQIPAPTTGVARTRDAALTRAGILAPAKRRSAREFKADFNAVLTTHGYDKYAIH